MRLLHTGSLALQEFYGEDIPKYAILSHTWEQEEVTFKDVLKRRNEHLAGWKKLKNFCQFARSHGHDYCWMDTACIEKKSSAELSEAITSMFQWYRKSEVCYAYLCDVDDAVTDTAYLQQAFRDSRWFTRGWTLQEMLAPPNLQFVGARWGKILGTKESLSVVISQITSIPTEHIRRWWGSTLSRSGNLGRHFISRAPGQSPYASVGQILFWASRRTTTRVEDMSYSLLGLLGVYIPLMYGEGQNAFYRLQLEIMNNTDDESLFAWQDPDVSQSTTSLLARSPRAFALGNFVPAHGLVLNGYEMKPRGLQVDAVLWPLRLSNEQAARLDKSTRSNLYVMPLSVVNAETPSTDKPGPQMVGVVVTQDSATGLYYRLNKGYRIEDIADLLDKRTVESIMRSETLRSSRILFGKH